jgi:pantothenate kinase-related protein Tda10
LLDFDSSTIPSSCCAALQAHQFRKLQYCPDFRLTFNFIEERRFFIVLLSGAPGTGKSTIASSNRQLHAREPHFVNGFDPPCDAQLLSSF